MVTRGRGRQARPRASSDHLLPLTNLSSNFRENQNHRQIERSAGGEGETSHLPLTHALSRSISLSLTHTLSLSLSFSLSLPLSPSLSLSHAHELTDRVVCRGGGGDKPDQERLRLQAPRGARVRIQEARGLRQVRTRQTLEPLAWRWSHWPSASETVTGVPRS